jgi:protein TonB
MERRANPITPENPIPRRTYSVTPRYPQEATASGLYGRVTLRITLDESGRVAETRALEVSVEATPRAYGAPVPAGDAGFVTTVADAVRQWQYEPPASAPIAFNVGFQFAPDIDGIEVNAAGAPIGPPPPWHEGAVRLGAGVSPPQKVRDVRPVYPSGATEAGVEGIVIVEARIEPDGRISHTRVLRSIPLLDQAAIDAVTQWEFTPSMLNGQAVPAIMAITINFTLQR